MSDAGVTLSFEVFPPKNDAGAEKLWHAIEQLSRLGPKFVSVTCGAGGSAIDGTSATVDHIRKQFDIDAVPHIAIARQSKKRVREALRNYKKAGVRRVVAIRGDPSLVPEPIAEDDQYPNTVDFVRELKNEFTLEPIVAAYPDVHPCALSPQQDLDHLKRKAEAGAVLAISQFFFLAETFLRFRDKVRAAGINIPLAPGIMPIHNFDQTIKFAKECGTALPDGFGKRFERHGADAKALFDEGVTHSVEVCERLRREGVMHFHFYVLNRSEMVEAICEKLNLTGAANGICH